MLSPSAYVVSVFGVEVEEYSEINKSVSKRPDLVSVETSVAENMEMSAVASMENCEVESKEKCEVQSVEKFELPSNENEWKAIGADFEKRWNFPNCLGAVDGKHIKIKLPPGSGSQFFNYKHFHSQVLMAIANANYELIYFHFGTNGRFRRWGNKK
ncbi:unnamed protein product [Arctia plantaginis]|uniref:DDE Tnp4 domain-containing protein n=1 Tax=Arctia plantaginis TaxID=874455 RepID=A0A8S1BTZ5_ARCPL|nr:unnamed protein product [Arctia plantaginis]